MTKEEIVKAIETRLEMLREGYEAEYATYQTCSKDYRYRIDELETLLEYIESPRIK